MPKHEGIAETCPTRYSGPVNRTHSVTVGAT